LGSITLYPSDDALVHEGYPTAAVWGGDPYLGVQSHLGWNLRTFLKFSLTLIPDGAVISLAKLRVYCYLAENLVAGVTNVQARRVSVDTWTERTITWSNQPSLGTVEDTKVPAVGWVEWSVTDWVKNEWAGDKTVSICLRCVTESYDGLDRDSMYRSKEYGSLAPELYIEYIVTAPVIATVTVTGTAKGGYPTPSMRLEIYEKDVLALFGETPSDQLKVNQPYTLSYDLTSPRYSYFRGRMVLTNPIKQVAFSTEYKTFGLSFTVYAINKMTGAPVSVAQVTMYCVSGVWAGRTLTGTTGADGTVDFYPFEAGTYNLTVVKAGFITYSYPNMPCGSGGGFTAGLTPA